MLKDNFICSVCGGELSDVKNENGKTIALKCENSHSFDLAKQGYVHLVKTNKIHSKNPGDTKQMVKSRRDFLEAGFYNIFADSLSSLCVKYSGSKENLKILDCGSGEGFYTSKIAEALPKAQIAGFDISREAVKMAAAKYKNIDFCVASVFDIPCKDESIDILTDVFSPLAEKEFLRVLKDGGIFIYAIPGERHLWQLKETLYENPYENEHKDTFYDGFELLERVTVKGEADIDSTDMIENLFSMTPYYWKTGVEGAKRLMHLEHLKTEIHFDFLVYRKNKNNFA